MSDWVYSPIQSLDPLAVARLLKSWTWKEMTNCGNPSWCCVSVSGIRRQRAGSVPVRRNTVWNLPLFVWWWEWNQKWKSYGICLQMSLCMSVSTKGGKREKSYSWIIFFSESYSRGWLKKNKTPWLCLHSGPRLCLRTWCILGVLGALVSPNLKTLLIHSSTKIMLVMY